MSKSDFAATKAKIIELRDVKNMSMVEIAVELGFKSAEAVYRYLRKRSA